MHNFLFLEEVQCQEELFHHDADLHLGEFDLFDDEVHEGALRLVLEHDADVLRALEDLQQPQHGGALLEDPVHADLVQEEVETLGRRVYLRLAHDLDGYLIVVFVSVELLVLGGQVLRRGHFGVLLTFGGVSELLCEVDLTEGPVAELILELVHTCDLSLLDNVALYSLEPPLIGLGLVKHKQHRRLGSLSILVVLAPSPSIVDLDQLKAGLDRLISLRLCDYTWS